LLEEHEFSGGSSGEGEDLDPPSDDEDSDRPADPELDGGEISGAELNSDEVSEPELDTGAPAGMDTTLF
jgi:hypothetical protein